MAEFIAISFLLLIPALALVLIITEGRGNGKD